MGLPERSSTAPPSDDERRVVGVDRVGPGLLAQPLDDRARSLEHRHQRIVLRLREREIDGLGVERALRLVRGAEALAGTVDEHAPEAPGHALRAVRESGHAACLPDPG